MAVTFPILFVCFLITFADGTVKLSSSLQSRNEANGNRQKFVINLKDEEKSSGNPEVDEIGKRFRRYVEGSTIKSNSVSIFKLSLFYIPCCLGKPHKKKSIFSIFYSIRCARWRALSEPTF